MNKPSFEDETASNFENFSTRWQTELSSIQSALATSELAYLESYRRLTSLNAWRELILEHELSSGAYGFFCEAQNDAISSHVFARLGSWRAAMQFLRSCIENLLLCEYYKDHPVELRIWEQGRHRLGFNEMVSYFRKHPDLEDLEPRVTGLDRLEREYSTLSKVVHSAAVSFRMTAPSGQTNLWTSQTSKLGVWSTRERRTLTGINLLLMSIHRVELQGARLPGLRQAIGLTIRSASLRNAIWTNLRVNLGVSR